MSESRSVMSDSLRLCIVYGTLQVRILEWVAAPFSRGSSQPRDQTSALQMDSLTRWATGEAQEYWSGLPIPFLADLLDPRIKPGSPALQADSLPAEVPGKPGHYDQWVLVISKIFHWSRRYKFHVILCLNANSN